MRRAALLLALALIAAPAEEALRTELGNKIGEAIMLRAALIEAQRENAALRKQVDDLKKPAAAQPEK